MKVSIPSNGSIQFLLLLVERKRYLYFWVSIPSNGSIQFLPEDQVPEMEQKGWKSLNPLKRVNSILTKMCVVTCYRRTNESQSPQTGQFNSYEQEIISHKWYLLNVSIPSNGSIQFLHVEDFSEPVHPDGLNPLKRVNSILTKLC